MKNLKYKSVAAVKKGVVCKVRKLKKDIAKALPKAKKKAEKLSEKDIKLIVGGELSTKRGRLSKRDCIIAQRRLTRLIGVYKNTLLALEQMA